MKERKNKRNGISLIVLVITIIVMLILAGAIILTLSNTNIINKASEAVDKTNTSQVQTIAKTAYLEAFAKGDRAMADLKESVIKSLKENGIAVEDYEVIVTPEGVDIKSKASWTPKWTQDGTVVTDGVQTLGVGELVDYKSNVTGYEDTNGWRILGAENGKVILISNEPVGQLELGAPASSRLNPIPAEVRLKETQKDWVTAIEQLDTKCEPFGKGTYAEYARSANGEDIDRMCKLDPTTQMNGNYYAHGTKITFKWGNNLYYYWSDEDYDEVNLQGASSFIWYDMQDKVWRKSTKPEAASDDNIMIAVDNNDPTKQAIVVTDCIYTDVTLIEEGSVADQVFAGKNGDYDDFWLADKTFQFRGIGSSEYGIRSFWANVGLINSKGEAVKDPATENVRAVVVLKESVKFSKTDESSNWTLSE